MNKWNFLILSGLVLVCGTLSSLEAFADGQIYPYRQSDLSMIRIQPGSDGDHVKISLCEKNDRSACYGQLGNREWSKYVVSHVFSEIRSQVDAMEYTNTVIGSVVFGGAGIVWGLLEGAKPLYSALLGAVVGVATGGSMGWVIDWGKERQSTLDFIDRVSEMTAHPERTLSVSVNANIGELAGVLEDALIAGDRQFY